MNRNIAANRCVLVVLIATSYLLSAYLAYTLWLKCVKAHDDSFVMRVISVSLCLSIVVVCGISFPQRSVGIVAGGLCGIVVGVVLGPQKSSTIDHTMSAVAAGDLFQFRPLWTMLFAFVGTIIGQNLVEIRRLIARANRTS